ncbi:MAG TPA: hypothetical protein PLM33_06675 [Acidobacteriota bacterium]|nr:hypothetical protein [Acidobacteriota bacterium]HRV08576.1 hypothetical protein [Acidobacteriota bacterium]
MPVWPAWEMFGVRNGAPDLPTMAERLPRYVPHSDRLDPQHTIGCILLSDPVFFSEDE